MLVLVLVLMLCRVVSCCFVLIHVCAYLRYAAVLCVLVVVLHCIALMCSICVVVLLCDLVFVFHVCCAGVVFDVVLTCVMLCLVVMCYLVCRVVLCVGVHVLCVFVM